MIGQALRSKQMLRCCCQSLSCYSVSSTMEIDMSWSLYTQQLSDLAWDTLCNFCCAQAKSSWRMEIQASAF